MLDLRQMIEDFIRKDLQLLKSEELQDQFMLQAINEIDMNVNEREQRLLSWLNSYKVLLFFPPSNSKQVAHQILDFADNERTATRTLNKDAISTEYRKLYERLSAAAHRCPKSGNVGSVCSLASKALWCCYPSDVPIIDNYAERALQVISRLLGVQATKSDRYECFLEVWFLIYSRVAPAIDAADLKDYPYKVRVLDRLLWHVGQPSFDMG